ncbi:hypothetical protein AB0K02_29695 [Streptomyces sp. NPDC049597]|uniref:hypothetical protein n=1 Tax=Streptomyces sp. NPDC049597 TaxID=3155276 RepID=UPI00344859A4
MPVASPWACATGVATSWEPPTTSVDAVISAGSGRRSYEARGIGRPLPESIARTADWLGATQARHSSLAVVGFSAGMAMAGALTLSKPQRFSAAVLLSGTLPWDAGLPEEPAGSRGSQSSEGVTSRTR